MRISLKNRGQKGQKTIEATQIGSRHSQRQDGVDIPGITGSRVRGDNGSVE
jgi:hypothetical protein